MRAMKKMLSRVMKGEVGIGRAVAPVWALLVAGVVIAAAAGQAVGPILLGELRGTVGLAVAQTPQFLLCKQEVGHRVVAFNHLQDASGTIDGVRTTDGAPLYSGGDWIVTVSDEQTEFSAAIETQVGRAVTLGICLDNKDPGTKVDGQIRLTVPAGIRVSIRADGHGALMSEGDNGNRRPLIGNFRANTWLFAFPSHEIRTAEERNLPDLLITMTPVQDAAAGFYTIRGSITQVSH